MSTLLIPFPVPPWRKPSTELRIDVSLPRANIEKELEALYARLYLAGDSLHDLPQLALDYRGFVFRYREADGEHYIYVEDRQRARLAGYVIFNRLVELNRRADPHLRAPHAKFGQDYQRLGIATAIYCWWLDAGNCLISSARQSVGANALWHKLGKRYPLTYVDLRNKRLCYLSREVNETRRQDLHTRMLMLGRGCSLDRLAEQTGMVGAVELTLKPLPVAINTVMAWLRKHLSWRRR